MKKRTLSTNVLLEKYFYNLEGKRIRPRVYSIPFHLPSSYMTRRESLYFPDIELRYGNGPFLCVIVSIIANIRANNVIWYRVYRDPSVISRSSHKLPMFEIISSRWLIIDVIAKSSRAKCWRAKCTMPVESIRERGSYLELTRERNLEAAKLYSRSPRELLSN